MGHFEDDLLNKSILLMQKPRLN